MRTALFEFVRDGQRLLAIIVRSGASGEKYNFATAPESALQLGVTFYDERDEVAPHAHFARVAERDCQEFVLVQEGRLEVRIFREDGGEVSRFELGPGEGVLFQQGGHSLRCLMPTRLLEVKQGPYISPAEDKYPITPRDSHES